MKSSLLEWLACPACAGDLALDPAVEEDGEIMEGQLTCSRCAATYPIARGVPRFTRTHSSGDAATAAAFGYQWQRFAALDERYRRQFLDWIAPADESSFRGRLVLEGGCGKGRHTALAAGFGARAVVALDLSDAVDVAFRNTRHLPNAHVVQADLNHPPVRPVFDFAFSVGVLHHTPEPERGFRALAARVRPGGSMAIWVYGREGNGWIVHLVSPIRRHITSRLPYRLLEPIAFALTVPLYAACRWLYRPARGTRLARWLPYSAYLGYIADFPFHEQRTIVFDHLVAPIAFYVRRSEVESWIERAGLSCQTLEHHNRNSWRALVRVPVGGNA